MQAEVDKLRLLVHSVSGYEQHANVEVIESGPAVLPLCTIRASLEAHPVIAMNSLDATKVYFAMLKLIQLRCCKATSNNNESTSCAYGTRFACRVCKVVSSFTQESDTVWCPICSTPHDACISYDKPYQDHEDKDVRAHWSDVSNYHNNKWRTIHQYSAYFPMLGLHELEEAAQWINDLSRKEKIRNLNIVGAAALLLADNPDVMTERKIRVVTREKPSFGCDVCRSMHFDRKSARYCCEKRINPVYASQAMVCEASDMVKVEKRVFSMGRNHVN